MLQKIQSEANPCFRRHESCEWDQSGQVEVGNVDQRFFALGSNVAFSELLLGSEDSLIYRDRCRSAVSFKSWGVEGRCDRVCISNTKVHYHMCRRWCLYLCWLIISTDVFFPCKTANRWYLDSIWCEFWWRLSRLNGCGLVALYTWCKYGRYQAKEYILMSCHLFIFY